MATSSKFAPAARPLLRGQLSSRPANGHVAFIPQELARANPHVEFVVKQRTQREPIIRGFYLNDRDKVIPLKDFEVTGIQQKVKLLLDSSGAKIKPLKRRTVESTTEAARGIWSGLHDQPFKI
ncbi:uncharacterized protein B0H18DRAFT_1086139 [Fomitopsis serialis]|uniref:uncharacterized protein n=1 Tax=Fomitopsis serialis TaxID=139415 RepID=UPI00200801AA|nr:uncharacterized protein B0H18DRAFT_1086139 [Neoantrodia serialis]KAH9921445.1 hypothetical protein B0H18DRAFT_1086139 [Neoantrodia serialis]